MTSAAGQSRGPLSAVDDIYLSLANLGAATLYEAQGRQGALSSAIRPLDPNLRVAGPALTVHAQPGDNLIVHYALTKARPGDVLVIDAGGYLEAGLWGDLLTEAAMALGIAGAVIDGAVRDSLAIRAMGFPLFSRGKSIKGTLKNQPGAVGGPLVCAGAIIERGDIVVGDADGVVVVQASRVHEVVEAARAREAQEAEMRMALRGGATSVELMGLATKLAALGLR